MPNEDAKLDLATARDALATMLDVKLKDMPEWQAYRAVDRAIKAMSQSKMLMASTAVPRAPAAFNSGKAHRFVFTPTYTKLTEQALNERAEPIPTGKLIEFMASRRDLGLDLEKTKINVTSALSKDERFKSVPWSGGRAWWWADKPVPTGKHMDQLLE